MSFQVKPSTMASVVKGLYDLQPGENVCPSFSVFSVQSRGWCDQLSSPPALRGKSIGRDRLKHLIFKDIPRRGGHILFEQTQPDYTVVLPGQRFFKPNGAVTVIVADDLLVLGRQICEHLSEAFCYKQQSRLTISEPTSSCR